MELLVQIHVKQIKKDIEVRYSPVRSDHFLTLIVDGKKVPLRIFGTLKLGCTFVREAILHFSGGPDTVLCFRLGNGMAKHFYACS